MTRVIYVNGRYIGRQEAVVSVEDRGYMLADGVYEGFELRNGKITDMEQHLDRLWRSMLEIGVQSLPRRGTIRHILKEIVRRNRFENGFVYLQITRGVAPRDFRFPSTQTPLSIVCLVYPLQPQKIDQLAHEGIGVITTKDIRWKRPDIKSLQLLPGVLARQAASESGALEAWLVDDEGFITEGAASNAWIVNRKNKLITRRADQSILKGVTRGAILELLGSEQIEFVERPFTLAEAYEAKEAFITSSSLSVMPVVRLNDRPVASGRPGKLTLALRDLYREK